jgi:hypothetical protein
MTNDPNNLKRQSLTRLAAVVHAARVAHATLCDLQCDKKSTLSWWTQLDVQAATAQLHAALLPLEPLARKIDHATTGTTRPR